MKTLEDVLADARGEAAVLRRAGHGAQAGSIEQLADAVAEAAHEYLTWLTDEEARLRSGHSVRHLRGLFPAWAEQGNARLDKAGHRKYRMLVVPRRARVEDAFRRGRERGEAA